MDRNLDTQKRPAARMPLGSARAPDGLMTMRVAVLPIPDEGDVLIVFLAPGSEPPEGVATALLVAPTERDAQMLACVYANSAAKI
jgi:hypothetical protein